MSSRFQNKISRRTMIVGTLALGAVDRLGLAPAAAYAADESSLPVVYHAKDVTPQNMVRLYDLLRADAGAPRPGRIGIKLHGDEVSMNRPLWEALREHVPGSVYVEGNWASAYESSSRGNTDGNREAIIRQGVRPEHIDILDRDKRYRNVPIAGGRLLKEVSVSSALLDEYGTVAVAANWKIPSFAGFSGAVKNVGIGLAGAEGKTAVHGDGFRKDAAFFERLAEAAKGVSEAMPGRLLYLNVLTNVQAAPLEGAEVHSGTSGILASLDMTAADQAAVDLLYGLTPAQYDAYPEAVKIERGFLQLEYLQQLGFGSRRYRLVEI